MNMSRQVQSTTSFMPFAFRWKDIPGFVERLEGQPLPVARIFGWFAADAMPAVALVTDSARTIQANTVARQPRPDVVAGRMFEGAFAGFVAEFLLEDGEQPATFLIGNSEVSLGDVSGFAAVRPHYDGLFTQREVLNRQHIYGSGPPTDVAGELKEFALLATGAILDFGCGNGDLLLHLRQNGKSAQGIELDEDRTRNALQASLVENVTFYDGGLPLPFADGEFDSIVSTEVIEHVPGIESFVPELARILTATGRLFVTTPDITSVPSSFSTGTVPWHLLESTHLNFFTPKSVETLFQPRFQLEALYSLCSNRVSGLFIPGSIGAVFRKRPE